MKSRHNLISHWQKFSNVNDPLKKQIVIMLLNWHISRSILTRIASSSPERQRLWTAYYIVVVRWQQPDGSPTLGPHDSARRTWDCADSRLSYAAMEDSATVRDWLVEVLEKIEPTNPNLSCPIPPFDPLSVVQRFPDWVASFSLSQYNPPPALWILFRDTWPYITYVGAIT